MAAPIGQCEVVCFNERFCGKKSVKTRNEVPAEEPQLSGESSNKPKLFNYTKARYEVMRFALSGFEKEKQIKSKVAMAIRLGAKPPKKEYTNYKVLMQEKLEEKERKKNEAKHHLQTTKPRKKRNLKKYKKQLLQASKQGKKDKKQPNNLIK